ncbi:hypothetical protein [Xanthobacter aminoxidans]|uniref:hypothetical protein n=1 Tax=Xanthobacter aminoxidans TaxID=186280 RepID=UPI002022F95B|nr:hypothetical protein [Xanthobacter aminoxidans]MCL8385510.1 hypothetical protein [Xanthobacter aminoxidans]
MAEAKNRAVVHFSTTLTLNETEIRALEAMIGYGADAFLKAFKEKLGESYIRNHEGGIRSLFASIGREVLPALREITIARELLEAAATERVQRRQAPGAGWGPA